MKRNNDSLFAFISYSRADRPFVARLQEDLQARGVHIWIDQEGIQPGTPDWEEALRTAVRNAHAVLLIASPHGRSSRYVKDELRVAEVYKRPVCPIWIAGNEWIDAVPLGWGGSQYIDARESSYAAAVPMIITTLSKLAEQASFPSQEECVSPTFEPRNPYKGLRAFTSQDAHDFFGREQLITELGQTLDCALLREQQRKESERLLAVIGPSGSGKSSVVLAGLLPRLQTGMLPGSQGWIYLTPIAPGMHPIEALALAFAEKLPWRSLTSLREDLEDDSARGLHLLASSLSQQTGTRVVLVVDQLEELFTLTATEEERRHFIDLLVAALTEHGGPVLVLLTLRADFDDRPMRYPDLGKLIEAHRKPVLPMEVEDLRATIEKPAALPDVQLFYEGNLVGDLLFEVQGQIGALPLLQFTLDQLFERRDGHRLTLQAYHDIGGVKGALSQHTEQTYASLPSEEHRSLARALFLRLLEPGSSQQDTTRRRASLSEFTFADPVQTRLMRETIDTFIAARLLTASDVGGTTTIEVGHEAVIREWQRLASWLHEAREDIGLQQALSDDVTRWEQHHRPKERLYRGTQLKEVQAWAERNRPSEREAAFLHASAARRAFSLVRLVAVLLLLVSFVMFATWQGWAYLHRPDPTLVTHLQDSGVQSLRWCIKNAKDGSTIKFAPNLKGIIELTGGSLVVANKRLTLEGPGAKQITITSGDKNSQILVSKGVTLTITGLGFKNSKMEGSAFLRNEGVLTIDNSVISGNDTIIGTDSYNGGGGISNNGILTVTNSIISNNSSSGSQNGRGGGIYNDGKLIISHSYVSGNIARGKNAVGVGGGIYNYTTGTVTVINSTFSSNESAGKDGQGGGIDNHGNLTVKHSKFLDNSALSNGNSVGGGIDNLTGTVTIVDSIFSGNQAIGMRGGHGGGIANTSGKLAIIHSVFSINLARGGNSTGGHGGGIANLGSGIVTVTSSSSPGNMVNNKPNDVENEGVPDGGKLTISH